MHRVDLSKIILLLFYLGSCQLVTSFSVWQLPWRHSRTLQQAAAGRQKELPAGQQEMPMCMWNEVKEACTPSHLVYLSLKAQPSTILSRAATQAYDRNLVCNGRVAEASCIKDRSNRCFWWNKSCVGLDAYELVNWLGAGSQVTGDAALLAFTCPGTQAAVYKTCKSATDAGPQGICNQLPGCQFVPVMKECVPKAFDSKSFNELQGLIKAFSTVDPTSWGSCEGACYVRQASMCQQSYNSSAGCQAKPYCVWEFDSFDGRKVCVHRDTASRGPDAFSKEYAAVKDACTKLKGQESCEKRRIQIKHVGKFRAKPLSRDLATAAQAGKCVI